VKSIRIRCTVLASGLLAAIMAVAVMIGPSASAGTGTGCYQNSCNNLDPTKSYNSHTGQECTTGDYTVHSIPAFGGTLDLRWGPDCTVNWTRFTPSQGNTYYQIWTVRESDNYATTYEFLGQAGVGYYDNEVYIPGNAGACVSEWNGSQWLPDVCYWQ
jgi:hypothetical protein